MYRVTNWLVAIMLFCVPADQAAAAWHEARSEHFIIYADLEPVELEAYGERLERFDQAIRNLRSTDDPPLTDAQRLKIFALKDEDAVGRLVGSSSILGFYLSSAAGSYAFVPRKAGFYTRRAEITAESVFFHEYAHHFQLGGTSAALPAWMTEGFAEFFATAEILDNGSVRIGTPPMDRQWSVQRYDGLTIVEMLAGSLRNATGREIASLYGRGWLLTHMLTFDTSRRGQLQRYVNAIQAGTDPLQAAKTAFGDDLRSVDRDLDQYLRQSRFSTLVVDGQALSVGPIAIRPLRPGEAAIMNVHMRLRLGADRKEAGRMAEEARKLSESFSNEPAVQVALAEAEFNAGNFSAAVTAGRKAVAASPGLSSAAIIIGKAKMELAQQAPATADWREIRSWFLRANKEDPENAEPLKLFYDSFIEAKEDPTANAIDGLLYAVVLAPRDEDLRIEAVRQLVVNDRIAEARKLFGPAAFYPHSGDEWRARKALIMDALTKLDRQAALSLLDAELTKRRSDED